MVDSHHTKSILKGTYARSVPTTPVSFHRPIRTWINEVTNPVLDLEGIGENLLKRSYGKKVERSTEGYEGTSYAGATVILFTLVPFNNSVLR